MISFDGNRTEHKTISRPPIATRPSLFQYTHHHVEIGQGVEIFIQRYRQPCPIKSSIPDLEEQTGRSAKELRRSTTYTHKLRVSVSLIKILHLLTDEVSHPDLFVSEEEQEHHTPSLRHDDSNQERTYTRPVVSSRKFRVSTTPYGQTGRRDCRFDCHGIATTTNSKRRSHSLTRMCLNTTHSHLSEPVLCGHDQF